MTDLPRIFFILLLNNLPDMSNKYAFILLCCLSLATGGFAMPSTPEHLGVEDGLSNNYVKDVVQDGKGCIWVATESGLNRFDGNAFTVFDENNSGLVGNELNTLLYDGEENKLWIGSQRNGISIFDCSTHQFLNLTVDEGLATNDVTHLSHASDGGIWITHYHVGIEYYDRKTGALTLFSGKTTERLPAPNWVACDDRQGNLYVGHVYDGLSVINLITKTVKTFANDPGNPRSLPGDCFPAKTALCKKKTVSMSSFRTGSFIPSCATGRANYGWGHSEEASSSLTEATGCLPTSKRQADSAPMPSTSY
jgi:ligand-binding sensor domain-containing protein